MYSTNDRIVEETNRTYCLIKMSQDEEQCELTADQRAFLDECNEEFINRYTFKDENYKNSYERDITKPPIISPWHGRSRANFNRPNYRNYNDSRSNYRNNHRDRSRSDNRNNRYDRKNDRNDRQDRQYRDYY